MRKSVFVQGVALGMANIKSQGVCLELCRRWVSAQIDGTWVYGETIWDFNDQINDVHAKQVTAGTLADMAISGYGNHRDAFRAYSTKAARFAGLRSRDDVIDAVLALPGAYIYCAGKDNSGHAFAFAHSGANTPLAFFDPNQGEWLSDPADDLKAWWHKFWDATGSGADINYKRAFHNGFRSLYRYTKT